MPSAARETPSAIWRKSAESDFVAARLVDSAASARHRRVSSARASLCAANIQSSSGGCGAGASPPARRRVCGASSPPSRSFMARSSESRSLSRRSLSRLSSARRSRRSPSRRSSRRSPSRRSPLLGESESPSRLRRGPEEACLSPMRLSSTKYSLRRFGDALPRRRSRGSSVAGASVQVRGSTKTRPPGSMSTSKAFKASANESARASLRSELKSTSVSTNSGHLKLVASPET
mmetsp:Transcript_22477/g.80199  ORF Transcript_22477/g.80199 Transcript_22477/m.80199 type:complete len:233 (+) Transcript_22477:1327-2025(+)